VAQSFQPLGSAGILPGVCRKARAIVCQPQTAGKMRAGPAGETPGATLVRRRSQRCGLELNHTRRDACVKSKLASLHGDGEKGPQETK